MFVRAGLDRDELAGVKLVPGEGLPHDWSFALMFADGGDVADKQGGSFDPESPSWMCCPHEATAHARSLARSLLKLGITM